MLFRARAGLPLDNPVDRPGGARVGFYRIAKSPDGDPPTATESFWMTHNMTSPAAITEVKKNRPSIGKSLRSFCHLVWHGQVPVKV
jgi:hypothetical protein